MHPPSNPVGSTRRCLVVLCTIGSLCGVAISQQAQRKAGSDEGDRAHLELFSKPEYPSAQECAVCHPDHYREWSASPHAYAQISPTFNAYQGKLHQLTNGTLGDFCERCHTQVGMSRGEPVMTPNDQRHEVVRPRPDVTGEVEVTTTFSETDRVILDWTATHFVLTDVETVKAGVTLQVFFHWLSQQ